MNEREPQTPEPLDERPTLRAALARAAEGEFDEDLTISLRVAGGAPTQRYRFDFTSRGGRVDVCSLDCELSKRHGALDQPELVDGKTLAALSRTILRTELLGVDQQPPHFLPDTVVGILEIAAGGATHRIYFAADPDQASVQEVEMPDAVIKSAEAIYKTAEKALGLDNVRP
jgi:hypothetical protein